MYWEEQHCTMVNALKLTDVCLSPDDKYLLFHVSGIPNKSFNEGTMLPQAFPPPLIFLPRMHMYYKHAHAHTNINTHTHVNTHT